MWLFNTNWRHYGLSGPGWVLIVAITTGIFYAALSTFSSFLDELFEEKYLNIMGIIENIDIFHTN